MLAQKSLDKSLPKVLFCGKFNLTEDTFQLGLAENQFQEVIAADGSVRYSWNVQSQEVSQTSSSYKRLKSTATLGVKDANLEKARMGSWKIGLFQPLGHGQKAITGSAQPLALKDKEHELDEDLWSQAQAQLSQAKGSFEKMIKDCKKHLQSVGVDAKHDPLYVEKEISYILQREYTRLDHLWQWKETPEQEVLTVERFDHQMLESSKAAESMMDKMAGIKGQLNARAARQKHLG
eukprot:Skav207784  [mRNA]  locus=scaffold70:108542:109402:+ [translate_table: standard]